LIYHAEPSKRPSFVAQEGLGIAFSVLLLRNLGVVVGASGRGGIGWAFVFSRVLGGQVGLVSGDTSLCKSTAFKQQLRVAEAEDIYKF
jgi:hypothetical protein